MIRRPVQLGIMSAITKLSVAEYEKIVASGVFDGRNKRRIELVAWGTSRDESDWSPEHAAAVDWLNEWSLFAVPRGTIRVRVQNPVAFLPQASEPEPDIVWANPRGYAPHHPTATDVLLLIEVADPSLGFDRGEKAELYAAAGVRDYWVVNLTDRTVEVFRDPQGGRYQSIQSFGRGEVVHPAEFPDARLNVDSLFAALA